MIIETIDIPSGLTVVLADSTSHYFGGYFHVRVAVTCEVPVERCDFDDDVMFAGAEQLLGSSVRFERSLEKMAVPEADIDTVRQQLISDFRATTLTYLSSPEFAPRFVRSEYARRTKKTPFRPQYRVERA